MSEATQIVPFAAVRTIAELGRASWVTKLTFETLVFPPHGNADR